jgi:hypothetical protein
MWIDMTKLIVIYRNFLKLPKNTTAHTTILPQVASVEGKCVLDTFLIPKFHFAKI